jgi:5-(carboxyamino)imidazole ribonucleotide synthase
MNPLFPGSTWIGILGGGQLGRMLAWEARRAGYRVITWTGVPETGPADAADLVLAEPFDSPEALERFLDRADVATVEFENIPAALLEQVAARRPLSPSPDSVAICQHREREKGFLSRHGFPCVWHEVVQDAATLRAALDRMPVRAGILKTAEFGYDGKGQVPVNRDADAAAVWAAFGSTRAVLEERIDLAAELSVLVVRDHAGAARAYEPAWNTHRHHILDWSLAPSGFRVETVDAARELALAIAETLDYRGVLAVECFLARDGRLLVNELAPRPHNSGHHTLDACETSQFEQQLRVMCGLPAGGTATLVPAVMSNLLGDIWSPDGTPPDWRPLFATPGACLHLYGKAAARPGRKMGHVTFLAPTRREAIDRADRCRVALGLPPVGLSLASVPAELLD